MKQGKNLFGAVLLLCILHSGLVSAQDDPNAILDQIRSAQAQINRPLSGRLRPENGDPVPFQLQLTENGAVLTDQKSAGQQVISGLSLSDPVRGTDITYEDLSLRFIYWRNAKFEGEQRVRTITCSIVLVQTDNRSSEYGTVRLWIAKDRGALIKAEGYNRQGKPVKRFEVISGQQIEGKTIFKQIRIEKLDPQTSKVVSRTYLELDPTEG